MADNIYIDKKTGEAAAMFADTPAWHKLGTVTKGAQDWQTTMRLAHLDFKVSKHQLLRPAFNNKAFSAYTYEDYQAIKPVKAFGMFREDTGAFLGAVGEQYTPIQNEYAFNFVDALLEAEGGAHYDSAGALGSGEIIFVSAKIPMAFRITGTDDVHETYLLFVTSHNGSLANQAKLTDVRVVCNNTLNMALRLNGSFIKIKHTKTAEEKLEKARKFLKNANDTVKSIREKFEILSKRELDKPSFIACLDKIFPDTKKDQEGADMTTRRANILRDVTELFAHNDDDAIPEIKGTAYNLLNAITEYTDHKRPTRITAGREMYTQEQGRAEAAVFGSGAQLKTKALEYILEETKDCKIKVPQPYMIPDQAQSKNLATDKPFSDTLMDIIDATKIN